MYLGLAAGSRTDLRSARLIRHVKQVQYAETQEDLFFFFQRHFRNRSTSDIRTLGLVDVHTQERFSRRMADTLLAHPVYISLYIHTYVRIHINTTSQFRCCDPQWTPESPYSRVLDFCYGAGWWFVSNVSRQRQAWPLTGPIQTNTVQHRSPVTT